MIGKTLAHYEIIDLLGKGGMGEVYRARDTRLRRDVALKFLPLEWSRDPERCKRFEREAHALASLQHPNVATIYGIEEVEGIRFLVMELIEGDDLSQRLSRQPIPVRESLEIAQKIAAGLEAAHEKGIVHRDLKPANIKLTPEGEVKILDFGLAQACQGEVDSEGFDSDSPTLDLPMTKAGTILGTTAYMSPEQARGEAVDKRTDVWAFACVLYEMLTGQQCFAGDSATDVLASVVTKDPDWTLLPADLPARGQDLLQQALEKDSRRRPRDLGDIGLTLEKCRAELEMPPPVAKTGSASARPWRWVALGLILGAIVVGLLTRPWTGQSEPADLLSGATFTRVTDSSGSEVGAAISRDGKNIACLSRRDGQWDIWVIPVGTGQPYNLTNGLAIGGVSSLLRSVGFSYDGSEVWLSGSYESRLRRIPLLGGTPRNWLGPEAINVSWSPGGNRIVYHSSDLGDPLIVADRDGSDRREILNSGSGYHQHYPTWGADGWIYLVRGQETTSEMDLWRIRPDGTGSERLITDTVGVAHPTPIDEKTLLFIAKEQNGAGPWLWAYDLEQRSVRRLIYGLEQYDSLAASADGRRLVASVVNPRIDLWQAPIRGEAVTESEVAPFELPTVRALGPRFGPEDLFYLSSRGTGDGLWRFRNGESREIWKGTETPLLEPVAVSTDGASLVLVLRQEGQNVLHVLSSDGAELRALSSAVDVRGSASWSPDGAWIVSGGEDQSGQPGLFKVSVEGDRVERLVDGQALNPVWSPAGDLIAYTGPQENAFSTLLGVRPDGTPVELPPLKVILPGPRVRFLPDGSGLIHMKTSMNFSQDFWLLDLSTMEDRRLTRLQDSGTIGTFDITPDGTQIVFDRLWDNADVVLIDLADR